MMCAADGLFYRHPELTPTPEMLRRAAQILDGKQQTF
jgi:hypothetical protein